MRRSALLARARDRRQAVIEPTHRDPRRYGTPYLIGYSGNVRRFPTAGHYARYNGTAPIEASSGPRVRHRLNPRGNRQLNHALHIAAVTQVAHDTPGRAYYLRKQAEGKTKKEALRALKRRISDAVYRQLIADATH